jgi:hypothetical protein
MRVLYFSRKKSRVSPFFSPEAGSCGHISPMAAKPPAQVSPTDIARTAAFMLEQDRQAVS